jgi:lipopolysaccharide transport system ATP-binding protein
MSRPIIRVDGLAKRYRLRRHETLQTFRERLTEAVAGLFRTNRSLVAGADRKSALRADEEFWALRNVGFEVAPGEVLGVIGRNGSGKSTLLKILSRITEPTEGSVELFGRVGSLLEVGSGFHPELTGRENIYLNGALLGMSRVEIRRRFDEIVDFAEVEQFLDTPVKRYSSGMYVRLAFAVAAHLEPEILIVDEVLAVGDAKFQSKCLGKMGEVARGGRTVLFVSHNLAIVSQLCHRVLLLDQGLVRLIDAPERAIHKYLSVLVDRPMHTLRHESQRRGTGPLRFTSFRCETSKGDEIEQLVSGQSSRFVIGYEAPTDRPLENVEVSVMVYTMVGQLVANLSTYYFEDQSLNDLPSEGQFAVEFPKLPFRSGRYVADLYCSVNGNVSDWLEHVVSFDVIDGDYYGTGKVTTHYNGVVFVDHSWSVLDREAHDS